MWPASPPTVSMCRRPAKALAETELRVDSLTGEVMAYTAVARRSSAPPVEWIKDKLANLQQSSSSASRARLNPPQPPRPDRARTRHPRHRPPLLPRRRHPRRPRPHRGTAPRWCGGRFESFVKVETAGARTAKNTEFAAEFSDDLRPSCGRVGRDPPTRCGRPRGRSV